MAGLADDGGLAVRRGGVMEQRSVVVVAAKRTPMGRFLGAFSEVPAVELGITAARAAMDAAGIDPGEVEETVAGHGRQAGNGPNPGRQVSVRAGVPETVPAYTVNKACGSSSKALTLAAGSIILGEIDVALVIGMENMTRTPYLLRGMRGGYRMGPAVVEDAMSSDGFLDPLSGEVMGETAENLAERYAVTREEQDVFALQSRSRPPTPAGARSPSSATSTRGPTPPWRAWPGSSRCSATRARSPPATHRGSATGRPRWW
jgi:acetyl-CoA C-acetyltransferase